MTRDPIQAPPRGSLGVPVGDRRRLGLPAGCTGALMAAYLLLRPYGDAAGGDTVAAADAFASAWWVVAHVCGLLALASFAWLVARFASVRPERGSGLARVLALAGTVLVLPYYGAETFALHVIGQEALTGDPAVLGVVEPIRNQPVAMTMFGIGLVLLAVSAVLLALAWVRSGTGPAWSIWPLAAGIVLFLPQFFLPPGGRMVFGVAYAVAAAVLVGRGLARGR